MATSALRFCAEDAFGSCSRARRFVSVVLVSVTLESLKALMLSNGARSGAAAMTLTAIVQSTRDNEERSIVLPTDSRSAAVAGVMGVDICTTWMAQRMKATLVR
jgi:hypothetical protein